MRRRAVLPINYVVKDEKGNYVPVPRKIMRPITDPTWNAKQAGTKVRMSKKERLKQRQKFRKAVEARKAEASV